MQQARAGQNSNMIAPQKSTETAVIAAANLNIHCRRFLRCSHMDISPTASLYAAETGDATCARSPAVLRMLCQAVHVLSTNLAGKLTFTESIQGRRKANFCRFVGGEGDLGGAESVLTGYGYRFT